MHQSFAQESEVATPSFRAKGLHNQGHRAHRGCAWRAWRRGAAAVAGEEYTTFRSALPKMPVPLSEVDAANVARHRAFYTFELFRGAGRGKKGNTAGGICNIGAVSTSPWPLHCRLPVRRSIRAQ